MAIEAKFTVEAEVFPLGTVFATLPGVTVELERVVPGPRAVTPYIWVRGVQSDVIESAFTEHPGVMDIRLIDSIDDEYLLRVAWDPEYEGILSALAESQIPLIKAIGNQAEWTFEIRSDNRTDIATFQRLCRERDIPVTMTALHALTPLESGSEATLTVAQREALTLAYDRGYFNSPRDITLEELGAELGISQQAVSSRLRRGIYRLLGSTLSAVSDQPRV